MGLFGRKTDDENIREALDRCRQREQDEANERARRELERERNDR